MARALALQRREDAFLLRQRPEGLLSRLLLRQAWRRLHLSDGDGRDFLSRGRGAARRHGGPAHAVGDRRGAREGQEARDADRGPRVGRRAFPEAASRPAGARGARLSRAARDFARRAVAVSPRVCGARPPRSARCARRQGRLGRDDDRGGPAGPRRGRDGSLRPLPRPGDVPDLRPRRRPDRLRRTRARQGRPGQIPEFPRDRTLPQGLYALQPPQRPQGRA